MNKEIYGRIYMITNLVNNKKYIGQTVQTIKSRFQQHCSSAKNGKDSCMAILKAIKKYGRENFIVEEIDIAYSQKELDLLEGIYISWFNTLKYNGYNISTITNGKGKISKETKLKMKISSNRPERLKQSSKLGKQTRGKPISGSTSKYVGVAKRNNIYVAQISINKKRIHIGHYNDELNAAKAYDLKALELFGNDCNLNFPELRNDYISGKITVNKNSVQTYSKSGIKGIRYRERGNYWIFTWKCNITNKTKSKHFKELEHAKLYKLMIEVFNNPKGSDISPPIPIT